MTFIETNSRTFREKQKDFFEHAEKGETVIIKRKNQYYQLMPVEKPKQSLGLDGGKAKHK